MQPPRPEWVGLGRTVSSEQFVYKRSTGLEREDSSRRGWRRGSPLEVNSTHLGGGVQAEHPGACQILRRLCARFLGGCVPPLQGVAWSRLAFS